MHEFTTVSSSSYDPAALATKLTEKSAEGWTVVSIVSTGGDVTAFLSREASGADTSSAATTDSSASASWSSGSSYDTGAAAVTSAATSSEPSWSTEASTTSVSEPATAEPAGWGVAPEPAPVSPTIDPQPAAAATYTPAATTAYTPAPAAAIPAVPAGWYADPAGRFELRYWDGGTWTEHVSRAGQQYTDPPVA